MVVPGKSRALRLIAANRRNRMIALGARTARSYLRAFDNVNHNLATNGEAAAARRIASHIQVAVDVGMHEGKWTDVVLDAQPTAAVHGFEASPAVAAELQRRYAADTRVTVHSVALGPATGSALLHVDPRHPSVTSLLESPTSETTDVEVEVRRGAEVLAEAGLSRIDFLKVDVEGYDLEVLRGFDDLLGAGAVRVLEFEYNQWNIVGRRFLGDFYDLLDPLGYDIGKVHPGGVDFRPYSLDDENWIGPACIAVLRSEPDLIHALRGR